MINFQGRSHLRYVNARDKFDSFFLHAMYTHILLAHMQIFERDTLKNNVSTVDEFGFNVDS